MEEPDDIPFEPVPVRARRDGWTPERQRDFIRSLRRIGSVSTAARAVGKTRRSAYMLRDRPDAESFAAAWDEALEQGFFNVQDHVIERALNGAVVPTFRKGRRTGTVHRFYDGVALAVLSGRGATLKQRLEQAEERGARRAFFEIERAWQRDCRALSAEQDRRTKAEAKLKRLVDAGIIGADWLDPIIVWPHLPDAAPATLPNPPHGPRIRRL